MEPPHCDPVAHALTYPLDARTFACYKTVHGTEAHRRVPLEHEVVQIADSRPHPGAGESLASTRPMHSARRIQAAKSMSRRGCREAARYTRREAACRGRLGGDDGENPR